jgi:eukaryotic-like serine/threonine-protein kinase
LSWHSNLVVKDPFDISSLIYQHRAKTYALNVERYAYDPPESSSTNRTEKDIRSQIYSCGLVFYEMLTGTRPFLREDQGKVIKRWEWKISPRSDIPANIFSILQGCLQARPEDRYSNLQELIADLQEVKKSLDGV